MSSTPEFQAIIPKEHGASIALLTGLATGIGCAPAFTWNSLLTVFAIGFAYLSHAPLLASLKQRPRGGSVASMRVAGIAGLVSAALCGVPLLIALKYFFLFAIAGGIVFALSLLLNRDKRKRGVMNELLVFAGLGIAAPAMYYAGAGEQGAMMAALWLFNFLFFGATVLTVKIRLKGKTYLLPTVMYGVIAGVVLFCGAEYFYPAALLAAFLPLIIKLAVYMIRYQWFQSARLTVIGIVETVAAVAFAAIVIVLHAVLKLP